MQDMEIFFNTGVSPAWPADSTSQNAHRCQQAAGILVVTPGAVAISSLLHWRGSTHSAPHSLQRHCALCNTHAVLLCAQQYCNELEYVKRCHAMPCCVEALSCIMLLLFCGTWLKAGVSSPGVHAAASTWTPATPMKHLCSGPVKSAV